MGKQASGAFFYFVFAVAIAATSGALRADPAAESQNGSVVSADDIENLWPTLQPVQHFAILEQLLAARALDRAEALLRDTHYEDADNEATRLFFIGVLKREQGKTAEAVAIFQDILARNPDYARVRIALAETLLASDDVAAARDNLQLVLADTASNPDLQNTVRSYIAAVDARRRWEASVYLSIAPSTNFNQGSGAGLVYLAGPDGTPLPFQIAKSNLQKAGVGFNAGGLVSYRQPLGDALDLIFSGGLNTKSYRETEFNDALFTGSVGPRMRFDWGYLGAYFVGEQRLYANDPYSLAWGGLVSAAMRVSADDIVFADVACLKNDYNDNWQGADLDFRDGHDCTASGRIEHTIDPITTLRVLGGVERERTGVTHLDNDAWSAGVGIYRELDYGVLAYGQALHSARNYDGIFPGASVARADRRWDFSLSLSKRDWALWSMVPSLQYTFTVNDSTVPFYEFDAHGVNLTLTRNF